MYLLTNNKRDDISTKQLIISFNFSSSIAHVCSVPHEQGVNACHSVRDVRDGFLLE